MDLETALAVIEATLAVARKYEIAGIQANAALATLRAALAPSRSAV